uniref:Integrase_H2C2 domain-containing protein n=1 Tax=Haemonchus placei TaxID=6290 RepID=A0A0N4W6B5_HAEPC
MGNTVELFKNSDNIWRARRRLDLCEESKFRTLIASKTELARLIIQSAHEKYHIGIAHTMSKVRQSLWIPRLHQEARSLVNRCVRCRRLNAASYQYPAMTDLYAYMHSTIVYLYACRVHKSRPFEHIGMNFRDLPGVQNGSSISKAHGCIFT